MQATVDGWKHVNVSGLSAREQEYISTLLAARGDYAVATTALGINPRTGKPYTEQWFRLAIRRCKAKIQHGVGGTAYSVHNFDKFGVSYTKPNPQRLGRGRR